MSSLNKIISSVEFRPKFVRSFGRKSGFRKTNQSGGVRQAQVYREATKFLKKEEELARKGSDPVEADWVEEFGKISLNSTKFVPTKPIQQRMFQNHFETQIVPRLLQHAVEQDVYKDAFGVTTDNQLWHPKYRVDLNFKNVKPGRWWGMGQNVAPEFAVEPPRIKIWTNTDQEVLLTIMIVDLDRPLVGQGRWAECCHLLLTNVKVKNHLDIIPPSAYTSTDSNVPGDVLLKWMPLHPPKQLPHHPHRMVCIAWQQEGPISPSLKPTEFPSDKAPWLTTPVDEGVKEYQLQERIFSPMTFAQQHNLSPKSLFFFRTRYTPFVSQLYADLKIHEPVLGPFPRDVQGFVDKVQAKLVTKDSAKEAKLTTLDKMAFEAKLQKEKKPFDSNAIAPFSSRRLDYQEAAKIKYASRKTQAKTKLPGLRDVIIQVKQRNGELGPVSWLTTTKRSRYSNV